MGCFVSIDDTTTSGSFPGYARMQIRIPLLVGCVESLGVEIDDNLFSLLVREEAPVQPSFSGIPISLSSGTASVSEAHSVSGFPDSVDSSDDFSIQAEQEGNNFVNECVTECNSFKGVVITRVKGTRVWSSIRKLRFLAEKYSQIRMWAVMYRGWRTIIHRFNVPWSNLLIVEGRWEFQGCRYLFRRVL